MVVAAQRNFPCWHVVIAYRAGGAHRLVVLGEDARYDLHPIGLEHAIRVDAPKYVSGGGVESIVSGGDQPLFLVLVQQPNRRFGMMRHELLHNCAGIIGTAIVDHQNLMWCNGLADGVGQAIRNALLFIPRWDDNRNIQHTPQNK